MLTQDDFTQIGKVVKTAIGDLAAAVKKGFDSVDNRFDKVENRLTGVETRLTSVETRLTSVETRLTSVETRLTGVEATMITKDFLEERLAKTDGKINTLVNVLEHKKVITEGEKRLIYT